MILLVTFFGLYTVLALIRCFADWKPREKCAEPKSTVSRCPRQPQRSNGSGKLLTLLSVVVAFDVDVTAYSKALARRRRASGAPYLRKFGNPSSRENLVVT